MCFSQNLPNEKIDSTDSQSEKKDYIMISTYEEGSGYENDYIFV